MRDAAASAKERIETGVGELRDQAEPLTDFDDDRPTIEVDVPADFSFTDFDPGAPDTPAQEIAAAADAAPAVRFDSEDEITTDDDGIPIWEDPA